MTRWSSVGFILFLIAGCGQRPVRRGDGGFTVDPKDGSSEGCVGLRCQIATCTNGTDTQVTGRLFAPNGLDPVPGAQVYVPNTGIAEFPPHVSCDICNEIEGAAASVQTAFDGTFVLSHLPASTPPGSRIPIVFQLGRFRRVIDMEVQACASQPVPYDPDVPTGGVRLPRRNGEFSSAHSTVPKIAVATGDYDQIECVLKRMGIEEIDLYNDRDARETVPTTIGSFEQLLADANRLTQYNILYVNCTENQFQPLISNPAIRANLAAFVGGGGRLFATDWAYDIIEQIPEFAPYICFRNSSSNRAPICAVEPQTPRSSQGSSYDNSGTIKDQRLSDWLAQFPSVIDANRQVPIVYSFTAIESVSTDPAAPVTVWVEGPVQSYGVKPMTVSFDYKQCGRVHFSTYNTEPNNVVPSRTRYPNCRAEFSPQERILEYFMFEIADCIPAPG